jgi:hypothetical protein
MRLLIGIAFLCALVPSLAFAQSAGTAKKSATQINAARTTAVRECATGAQRYAEYIWGNMEFQQYRACMTERRQAE